MAHPDEQWAIYWHDPDPRAILPLERFHIPRSLARTVRRGRFEIRLNSAFAGVIAACARPEAPLQERWISPEIIRAYTELHRLGFAHSVECWRDGHLVGGLYGVALRGLFAGESMFSLETDASKVALVFLVDRLRERGLQLLDIQFLTDHFRQFGAIELPRQTYRRRLARALAAPVAFV